MRTVLHIFCQSILAFQHFRHPVDDKTMIGYRDIGPENNTCHCFTLTGKLLSNLIALMMANGMVKLADFGLRTLDVSRAVAQSPVVENSCLSASLTHWGHIGDYLRQCVDLDSSLDKIDRLGSSEEAIEHSRRSCKLLG